MVQTGLLVGDGNPGGPQPAHWEQECSRCLPIGCGEWKPPERVRDTEAIMEAWLEIGRYLWWMREMSLGDQPDISSGLKGTTNAPLGCLWLRVGQRPPHPTPART